VKTPFETADKRTFWFLLVIDEQEKRITPIR
jgi:hypothetical protein